MANFTVGDGVRLGCGSLIAGLVAIFLIYALAMGSCAAMFSGGGSSSKVASVFDKKELKIPYGLKKAPKTPPRARGLLVENSFSYLYENLQMSTNSFTKSGSILEEITRRYEDVWLDDVVVEQEVKSDRNLVHKLYGRVQAKPIGEYHFKEYLGYKEDIGEFSTVDFLGYFTFCHNVLVSWKTQSSNLVIKGLAKMGWIYYSTDNGYRFHRGESAKIVDYIVLEDIEDGLCNTGH